MSDIEELQRRITAAMDQVAFGLDKLGAASAGPAEDTLRQLEDERTANAQLQERVRSLRTKSEGELAALRTQVEEGDARMTQLDIELQRVRRANAQLSRMPARRCGMQTPKVLENLTLLTRRCWPNLKACALPVLLMWLKRRQSLPAFSR